MKSATIIRLFLILFINKYTFLYSLKIDNFKTYHPQVSRSLKTISDPKFALDDNEKEVSCKHPGAKCPDDSICRDSEISNHTIYCVSSMKLNGTSTILSYDISSNLQQVDKYILRLAFKLKNDSSGILASVDNLVNITVSKSGLLGFQPDLRENNVPSNPVGLYIHHDTYASLELQLDRNDNTLSIKLPNVLLVHEFSAMNNFTSFNRMSLGIGMEMCLYSCNFNGYPCPFCNQSGELPLFHDATIELINYIGCSPLSINDTCDFPVDESAEKNFVTDNTGFIVGMCILAILLAVLLGLLLVGLIIRIREMRSKTGMYRPNQMENKVYNATCLSNILKQPPEERLI